MQFMKYGRAKIHGTSKRLHSIRHLTAFLSALGIILQEDKSQEWHRNIAIQMHNISQLYLVQALFICCNFISHFRHLRSHIYKTLQHQNIECLRKPEFLNTMEIPGKYRNHSMKEQ